MTSIINKPSLKKCPHGRIGSHCRLCKIIEAEEVAPVGSHCAWMESNGIGDTLLGACAVAGLIAKFPTNKVYYCVPRHLMAWASLFTDAEVLSEKPLRGSKVYKLYGNYGKELEQQLDRLETYCSVTKQPPAQPPVKLSEADVTWAEKHGGKVVLVLYASIASRSWGVLQWRLLEQRLHKAGYETVIVDCPNRLDPQRCRHFSGQHILNETPGRVAALVSVSRCVVGNDSSIPHLAGILGRRAVALIAQLDGQKVFGY